MNNELFLYNNYGHSTYEEAKDFNDLEAQIIAMGKHSSIAHKLLLGLFRSPITSVKDVQSITGLSAKAAEDLISLFVENRILTEITKQQRNRVFPFKEYLDLFSEKNKKSGKYIEERIVRVDMELAW